MLSWVRESHAHLDVPLWRAVSEWVEADWPFANVEYAPHGWMIDAAARVVARALDAVGTKASVDSDVGRRYCREVLSARRATAPAAAGRNVPSTR